KHLAEDSRRQQALGDLAWTRLTRWRELVSQIFENRSYCVRLATIVQIRVAFGGERPPTSAYYMAAWLLGGLEKCGAQPEVDWCPASEAGPGLTRVELVGTHEGDLRVSIAITADGQRQTAQIEVDGLSSLAVFTLDNDYVSLREELTIPGRDPVYDTSLARAALLASGGKS